MDIWLVTIYIPDREHTYTVGLAETEGDCEMLAREFMQPYALAGITWAIGYACQCKTGQLIAPTANHFSFNVTVENGYNNYQI